jgi:hypothetical protein
MVVRRDRKADEKPLPSVYPKKAIDQLVSQNVTDLADSLHTNYKRRNSSGEAHAE